MKQTCHKPRENGSSTGLAQHHKNADRETDYMHGVSGELRFMYQSRVIWRRKSEESQFARPRPRAWRFNLKSAPDSRLILKHEAHTPQSHSETWRIQSSLTNYPHKIGTLNCFREFTNCYKLPAKGHDKHGRRKKENWGALWVRRRKWLIYFLFVYLPLE